MFFHMNYLWFVVLKGRNLGFVRVCFFLQSWEIVARSGAFDNDLIANFFLEHIAAWINETILIVAINT